MAITDELREWCVDRVFMGNGYAEVLGIAERIDAAHRAALEKLAAQVDETSGMREFCERLDQAATNREDVQLWGVDYVPLPVDADGMPIHVGDVMEGEKIGGGFSEPFEVIGYIMSNGELEPMDGHNCLRKRKYLHHHHAPTVEDVLREFAANIADVLGGDDFKLDDNDELYAEYAAKLRLAEEVDE